MRKIYFTNLNNAPTDISLNLLKILHELIHELIHEPRYSVFCICVSYFADFVEYIHEIIHEPR